MTWSEDEYLMISGIQHFLFCRRQWALIHLEEQWAENRLTAEGAVVHKKAHDSSLIEKRPGILIVRGLSVASSRLGMTGQCDVVEFQKTEEGAVLAGHRGRWQAIPIEYKRGRDKEDQSDIAQLCCEALCLEDMLGCQVPYGYLFYHEIRRRRQIVFTDALRHQVETAILEMHQYFQKGQTPKVKPTKKCQSCSLKELCLPKLCRSISAKAYLQKVLGDEA